MLISTEILPHEMIKVLVEDGENEEECWAKVLENSGSYIFVTYLSATNKVYKGACILSFETQANRVDFENISEHHPGSGNLIEDLDMKKVGSNMYVFNDDIDPESDSEIEERSDTDSEVGSLENFVVSDHESIGDIRSPGTSQLNNDWNAWDPHTPSAKHFKKRVDEIEAYARHHADNLNFN